MKKKQQRVPDFSTKRVPAKGLASQSQTPPGQTPAPAAPVAQVKPHATSQKSGRRGS